MDLRVSFFWSEGNTIFDILITRVKENPVEMKDKNL